MDVWVRSRRGGSALEIEGVLHVAGRVVRGHVEGFEERRQQDGNRWAHASDRAQIEKAASDYDREKLEERLAKLGGGVAVIRVGAPSEAEMKSRKEALDDAISATKAGLLWLKALCRVAAWRCCVARRPSKVKK